MKIIVLLLMYSTGDVVARVPFYQTMAECNRQATIIIASKPLKPVGKCFVMTVDQLKRIGFKVEEI